MQNFAQVKDHWLIAAYIVRIGVLFMEGLLRLVPVIVHNQLVLVKFFPEGGLAQSNTADGPIQMMC